MKINLIEICSETDILEFLTEINLHNSDNTWSLLSYAENIPKILTKYKEHNTDFVHVKPDGKNSIIGDKFSSIFIHDLISNINSNLEGSVDYLFFIKGNEDFLIEELLQCLIYAKHFNKRIKIINDLNELDEQLTKSQVKSALVISHYSRLSSIGIQKLAVNYPSMLIGYLPYIDKFSINLYYLKNALFNILPMNHIQLIFDRVSNDRSLDQNESYYSRDFCNYTNVMEKVGYEKRVNEFNYISHCRECAILFNDFIFCGKYNSLYDEHFHKAKYLPSCCYSRNNCFIDGRQIINANTLNADILFLNGCNLGDLSNSIVPYYFTIASNIIENHAISIITTPSIKIGYFVENLLAHYLLMNGYNEGEKLYYINSFLCYSEIDNNLYFQIGDPSINYNKNQKNDDIKFHIKQKNCLVELEIKEITNKTYIDIDIPKSQLKDRVYLNTIIFIKDGIEIRKIDQEVFFNITNSIDNQYYKLIIFSKRILPIDNILISLTTKDPILDRVCHLNTYNDNLNFYKNLFPLENSIKGNIIDLQNNLKTLYPLLRSYKYCINTFFKVDNLINNIGTKYQKIFSSIFNYISMLTSKNLSNYFEEISEKRTSIIFKGYNLCSKCGEKELVYIVEYFLFDKKIVRYVHKCLNCGSIKEIPDDKLMVKINSNLSFNPNGGSLTLFSLINRHEFQVNLQVAVICIDSKDIEIIPEIFSISLQTGEEYDFTFYFKPKDKLKKQYYLFSYYLMADGKFYYLSDMLNYS